MAINPIELRARLRGPDLAALSDADAAAAFGPVKTPKSGKVTIATVASVLGREKAAALYRTIQGAAAQGNVDAILALPVLSGPGLDPADPEGMKSAQAFVDAKLISAEDRDRLLYDVAYPLGGTPTADDVATARADNALDDERDRLLFVAQDVFLTRLRAAEQARLAANDLIAAGRVSGQFPTDDDVRDAAAGG